MNIIEHIKVVIDSDELQKNAVEILERNNQKICTKNTELKFSKHKHTLTYNVYNNEWCIRCYFRTWTKEEIKLEILEELLNNVKT
jgi:hypothetical protein